MQVATAPVVQPDDPALVKHDSAHSTDTVCALRFLMINGVSFHLTVPSSSTIQDVKQTVIDDRPPELLDFLKSSTPSVTTMPSKTDEIRILYLGKFLDDTRTLEECHFAIGKDNVTVVHLSVRVPIDPSDDVKEKLHKKTGSCCVIM